MSNFCWLGGAQMERLRPFLSKSRGKPCVDDCKLTPKRKSLFFFYSSLFLMAIRLLSKTEPSFL